MKIKISLLALALFLPLRSIIPIFETMPFTSEQLQDITRMMEEFVQSIRPDPEIRDLMDIGWRQDGHSVFLFEIRPQWNDKTNILHHDFAKATWVGSQKHWKIFWLRANEKWNIYEPLPAVGNLQRFLIEVDKDPHHCFKG